jgi:hypothetical protein
MKLLIPSMVIYVAGVFGVATLRNNEGVSLPVLAALALIPGLAMLSWIWGHWRYISELDEYLQKLNMQSVMVGLAVILSVASVWGLLEMLVQSHNIPALPIFWVVPMFYVANGLAFLLISKSAGVKGACL